MSFQRPGSRSKAAFGVAFRPPPPQRDGSSSASTAAPGAGRRQGGSGGGGDQPMQRARLALPVARYRQQLLYLLETHATVVVVGETGSGKTTQLPQYLHEAGWTGEGHQVTLLACIAT